MPLLRPKPVFRLLHRSVMLLAVCGFVTLSASAQSGKKRPTPTPKPSASPAAGTPATGATPAGTPYPLPEVVATVEGQPINKQDLERVTDTLLQSNGRALKDLNPADQRHVFQSVADDMIIDRILARQSADEKVQDMDIEARFNVLRDQYPTPADFDAELKKSNQTLEQVRQNIRLQLAQKQWIESRIADQVKITPQEVEKFYKEGPPSKFDTPEMARASQILVAVKKEAPPEDALEAETKIKALAERVKKGEAFDAVAKSSSQDPNAKTTGGDMNYFSRDRIMPEFADAAFKLKVGEVSPPVRTQFGYHLIKLTDRKPAHNATFDEAKDQIAAYLQEEKRKDAVAALVKKLREDAKVEVFLP